MVGLVFTIVFIVIAVGAIIVVRGATSASKEFREKWHSRREFFRTARDDAEYFLEWWQRYSDGMSDTGTPSLPALLRRTKKQAERGIQMMDAMHYSFAKLTDWKEMRLEENRVKANRYLAATLITQDEPYRERGEDQSDYSDILPPNTPESLLYIMDGVVHRLFYIDGWDGYKQEVYQQGRRLVNLLDSPVYNRILEQKVREAQRFPNPHQVQQKNAPESADDRIEKRMDRWESAASWMALAYIFTNQNNK